MAFSALLQKQNRDVARKLGIATICMFVIPLGVFYFCYHIAFAQKKYPENWAGAFAIVAANIVVAGYVIAAFKEEDDTTMSRGDEAGPRVGAFKLRTD
mmetsp:Transcript_3356/g.4970  ORF Transcript_3356/g.4970 Transcript_3356/m.4970 type:complete len:98 (+) Transcript_3356:212-505(+)